eukprot:TRINITY_DN6460_c0_g1_i4.p1 TRINITY_DN6460_c0_g1~~TRINITY_DN6460_c0_g1_i4.p1  ORF type:complete len:207 (+),score=10.97 TRINITY_DN6460_c0_g1_i4:82-621(+)
MHLLLLLCLAVQHAAAQRYTLEGCLCKETWTDMSYTNFCFWEYCCLQTQGDPYLPEGYTRDHCQVQDSSCQGGDWGYCLPPGVLPATATETSTRTTFTSTSATITLTETTGVSTSTTSQTTSITDTTETSSTTETRSSTVTATSTISSTTTETVSTSNTYTTTSSISSTATSTLSHRDH